MNSPRIVIGYFILGFGIIGYIAGLLVVNMVTGIFTLLISLVVWLIVMYTGDTRGISRMVGHVLLVFGIIGSLGVFYTVGIIENMFGGQEIQVGGVAVSVAILFISIVLGVLFYQIHNLESDLERMKQRIGEQGDDVEYY